VHGDVVDSGATLIRSGLVIEGTGFDATLPVRLVNDVLGKAFDLAIVNASATSLSVSLPAEIASLVTSSASAVTFSLMVGDATRDVSLLRGEPGPAGTSPVGSANISVTSGGAITLKDDVGVASLRAGTIAASGASAQFVYSPARTRAVTLLASGFRAAGANATISTSGGLALDTYSSTGKLVGPIRDVPDGATITAIDCSVYDNDAGGDISIAVWRIGVTLGTTFAALTTASASSSSASPDPQILALALDPTKSTVDLNSFGYFFIIDGATSSTRAFDACRVTFTVNQAD